MTSGQTRDAIVGMGQVTSSPASRTRKTANAATVAAPMIASQRREPPVRVAHEVDRGERDDDPAEVEEGQRRDRVLVEVVHREDADERSADPGDDAHRPVHVAQRPGA